jgi:hypothetical protein
MARASSRSKRLQWETEVLSVLSTAPLQVSAILHLYEQSFDGDSTTPGAPESPRRLPMAQSGLLLVMSKTGQYTATSSSKLLTDLHFSTHHSFL